MRTHKRAIFVFENATLCQVNLPAFFAVDAVDYGEAVSRLKDTFNIDPSQPCVCGFYCKPFIWFKTKTIEFAIMRSKIEKENWVILKGINVVHRPECLKSGHCTECSSPRGREFDFARCWFSQRILFPKNRIKLSK